MGEVISMEREPLVKSEEVAAYLKVSVVTIQRWTRDKDDPLPAYKSGLRGFRRYKLSDVDKWLERRMSA